MQRVALFDVVDVDAYVHVAVVRLGLLLEWDEREELEAEGMLILFELAEAFDGRGTFSGYAARYLRPRILTAWHVGHRGEHVRSHRDGWTYRPAPSSWESETAKPSFDERRLCRLGHFARIAA